MKWKSEQIERNNRQRWLMCDNVTLIYHYLHLTGIRWRDDFIAAICSGVKETAEMKYGASMHLAWPPTPSERGSVCSTTIINNNSDSISLLSSNMKLSAHKYAKRWVVYNLKATSNKKWWQKNVMQNAFMQNCVKFRLLKHKTRSFPVINSICFHNTLARC